jgi:hypothetical protein
MATYQAVDDKERGGYKVVDATGSVVARFERMSDAIDFVGYLNKTEAH